MNQTAPIKLREVTVEALDIKGRGVGTSDTGGQLIVPYTIPGEQVRVEKQKRKLTQLAEVITPSLYRAQPRCRHFGACGGCSWQHINYEHQLRLKQQMVLECFKQHQLPFAELPITSMSSLNNALPFEYRNRMDFVWWHDGGLGLRRAGTWHTIEPLDECHLLPASVMDVVFEIHSHVHRLQLPFRDTKAKTPGLRYLVVRRGVFTGEVMLNFVTDPMTLPEDLLRSVDSVTSIYQVINDDPENDTSDGRPEHLMGERYYREKMWGKEFCIGPRSFFQPNPAMAQEMGQWLRERVEQMRSPTHLLDLYCGVGVFSLLLSDMFKTVKGIEMEEEAIQFAKINAENSNIEFVCANAEKSIKTHWRHYDTLLVDPPRSGLHPKVLRAVAEHPFQNLLYVSCNPRRGIEDIAKLQEVYEMQSVQLFDQFPQTPHVELLVHLQRRR